MCGRFELHTHPAAIALAFGVKAVPAFQPRYNIAPTQDVPVVRQNAAGERELTFVRWGLVPRWAKDPSIGAKMINARAETLAQKPSFRVALQKHRLLIPANGFYEWKDMPGGAKQPIHIGMRDGSTFAFAGLGERWLSPDGDVLDTCTIITTRANAMLAVMHDRMPAIVAPGQYERWLDIANADVADVLAPYPSEAMHWYPVSTRVNAVRNDDARLMEPLEEVETNPPSAEVSLAESESAPHEAPPKQAELF